MAQKQNRLTEAKTARPIAAAKIKNGIGFWLIPFLIDSPDLALPAPNPVVSLSPACLD
jgi:hypothetical protein